jgi:ribosomal protein S18 acetylase RimI-like enzyme
MAHIRPAEFPAQLPLVREILREYAANLGVDLCFQNFEAELDELPGKYAAPQGRMLLAWDDAGQQLLGCVALRPLDDGRCEMKRLYVRPQARGMQLGRRLAEAICSAAQQAGYSAICLDTLVSMDAAQALYAGMGFLPVPAYVFNPLEGVSYLALDLGHWQAPARAHKL